MLKQFLRQVDGYVQTVHPYKIQNTQIAIIFRKERKIFITIIIIKYVWSLIVYLFFVKKSFKRFLKYFIKVGKTLRIVTFHKFILITKLSLCEC